MLTVLTIPIATRLISKGVFAANPFQRQGPAAWPQISPIDLVAGLGLWFFGMALADLVHSRLWPNETTGAIGPITVWEIEKGIVLALLVHQPLLCYLAVRAWGWEENVWGPLRLGMGLGRMPAALTWAVRGYLIVFPFVVAVSILSLILLAVLIDYRQPEVGHELLQPFVSGSPQLKWRVLVMVAVLAPLFEELFFRGILQRGLIDAGAKKRPWVGILLASGLFAAMHFRADPTQIGWHSLPALFVLSVALGWVYERSGSLWAPIFLHAIFNGSQVALMMLLGPGA